MTDSELQITDPMLHIVFVDDDLDDQYLVMQAVKSIEYHVKLTFFDSGLSLFDSLGVLLTSPLPMLIMLDLNLPPAGGLDVLKQLKADAVYRKIPVVIYSTSSSAQDIDDAYELGADRFLVKPDTFTESIEVVRAMCDEWISRK